MIEKGDLVTLIRPAEHEWRNIYGHTGMWENTPKYGEYYTVRELIRNRSEAVVGIYLMEIHNTPKPSPFNPNFVIEPGFLLGLFKKVQSTGEASDIFQHLFNDI